MIARDAGYAEQRLLGVLDDAILAIAAEKRRHPVREYLTGLKWDGGDHIAALADTLQTRMSRLPTPMAAGAACFMRR